MFADTQRNIKKSSRSAKNLNEQTKNSTDKSPRKHKRYRKTFNDQHNHGIS